MTHATRPGRGLASLLAFASLVAVAAAFGAQFEPGEWYVQLTKPSWNPPNWVFAPVWSILYIAIAIAGWLVWRGVGRVRRELLIWGLQLVLNALWSALFFGWHHSGLALIDIILLIGLIVAFILVARRRSMLASWLFVPYALWVGFAAALNFAIWRLN